MIKERVYQSVKLDRDCSDALIKIAHDNDMNIYQLLEVICINFLSNPAIEEIKIKKEFISDINESLKLNKNTAKLLSLFAKESQMTRPELIESICKDFIEYIDNAAKEQLTTTNND